eukprot:UN24855
MSLYYRSFYYDFCIKSISWKKAVEASYFEISEFSKFEFL